MPPRNFGDFRGRKGTKPLIEILMIGNEIGMTGQVMLVILRMGPDLWGFLLRQRERLCESWTTHKSILNLKIYNPQSPRYHMFTNNRGSRTIQTTSNMNMRGGRRRGTHRGGCHHWALMRSHFAIISFLHQLFHVWALIRCHMQWDARHTRGRSPNKSINIPPLPKVDSMSSIEWYFLQEREILVYMVNLMTTTTSKWDTYTI